MALDRLGMRTRPQGEPIMRQRWEKLLFMHWPVGPQVVEPLLPPGIELDTFDSQAWIGVTPFSLTHLRVASLPSIPGLNAFDEINLRTYVHVNGRPGVWFFSLDASRMVPAMAARLFFAVPYYGAEIEFRNEAGDFDFTMERTGPPRAQFHARWRHGVRLRAPDTESLAFFLTERYCFFAVEAGQIHTTRIYHPPWILEEAELLAHESTLFAAAKLPTPSSQPLLHFSRSLDVDVWPLMPVAEAFAASQT